VWCGLLLLNTDRVGKRWSDYVHVAFGGCAGSGNNGRPDGSMAHGIYMLLLCNIQCMHVGAQVTNQAKHRPD
jgi:hypothetical protein